MPQEPGSLTKLAIRNYRSIAACEAPLAPLTALVGPNASGKSNFLDALRFVSDALTTSLGCALRERGGIAEVRRRSGGRPNHIGLRLEFTLPGGRAGRYGFSIAARAQGGWEVQVEECSVTDADPFQPPAEFLVRSGELCGPADLPPASGDALYLARAVGLPQFREICDALCGISIYRFSPERLSELQAPDTGRLLAAGGANLASVLDRLSREDHSARARIERELSQVAPGVLAVDLRAVGARETLEFEVGEGREAWVFPASAMPAGTLRALAVLTAVFQRPDRSIPLVGIDDAGEGLHFAARRALLEALRRVSAEQQILAATDDAGLLECGLLPDGAALAVLPGPGGTEVRAVDGAARGLLARYLRGDEGALAALRSRPEPDGGEERQLRLLGGAPE